MLLALCAKGMFSLTGLEPCTKCTKGQYQDEIGRSYCKQCPLGAIYAGIEGATTQADCPSKIQVCFY